MSEPGHPRPYRKPTWVVALGALVLAVLVGVGVWFMQTRQADLQHRLVATLPDDVAKHPELIALGAAQGRALFMKNCAACHGADMKGRTGIGAPNLTDGTWLYGDGDLYTIERIVLFGIRSDQKKSYNVTEMPAFGQRGQLTDGDISAVTQYLLQLSGRPYDGQAAELGKKVFNGATTCGDCHGEDAKGNADYGAPDLTANVWNYGGDPRAIYNSIYYGRHGVMPAWIGKLTLGQIRAVAVYVYSVSHK